MIKQDTGVASLYKARQGAHYCLLYKSEDDLIDLLSRYFQHGIANNEYCIWVAADSTVEKKARQACSEVVLPAGEGKKRIEFARAREWYLKGGYFQSERVCKSWFDKLDYSLERGYTGIRVTGDLGWQDDSVWSDLLNYELSLNKLVPSEKITAICSYPLDGLTASQLLDIAHHHQRTIVKNNGKWQVFETIESEVIGKSTVHKPGDRFVKVSKEKVVRQPVLYSDRCTGCGLCVSVCEQDLLYLQNYKIAVRGSGSCDWCTYCEAVCPNGAIACQFEIVLSNTL